MLNSRQARLLGLLIRDYIEDPRPVGSLALVKRHQLNLSPATVRNDFMVLEENGFIVQPHTSAGRIPTVSGYKYFVRYLLEVQAIKQKEAAQLRALKRLDRHALALALANISGESITLIESDGRYFVSGLSQLMNKPELEDADTRAHVGKMFDHFEHVTDALFKKMNENVTCLIGDGRFSVASCSIMGVKIRSDNAEPFIILMCGPVRMNYEANHTLLNHVQQLYA